MEDIDLIIQETENGMKESIKHLEHSFKQIRAGKASPAMVQGVMVDYYGNPTPLPQVANISSPDAQTITIQPWEKAMIQPIEKAIMMANLGFNPGNNGDAVIINVPPLTEERRKDLAKQAKAETENAKIGIRNHRKDGNSAIRSSDASEDLMKSGESDIQDLTDKYVKLAESHFVKKESEIMTI